MSGGRKFTSVSDSNLREVALTWSTDFLRFWCLNHIRPNSISNMLHLQILCRLPIASETGQVIEGQGEEIARRLLSYSGQSDTRVHIDLVNLVLPGSLLCNRILLSSIIANRPLTLLWITLTTANQFLTNILGTHRTSSILWTRSSTFMLLFQMWFNGFFFNNTSNLDYLGY